MKASITNLLSELEHNGCKGKIVPLHHLHDLQEEMVELCQSKLLNEKLIRNYLNGFQYDYSEVLPKAQSIIVAAVPQPITNLHVEWRGKRQEIIVPPIYIYTEADNLVLNVVERELKKENLSFVRAKLPLKLLAAKSGLSLYGRNNISYIQGMGSFYRLIALVTDLPIDSDTWQEAQRMSACDNCRACLNNCPTKCIDINRNIIHAEKCLTYFNESPEPFPEWVDSNWHNSWVGCMICQLACPQNNHSSLISKEEIFTEHELKQILYENDFTRLPGTTRNTLQKLNLNDYELTVLQRNLRALLL